LSESFYQAEDFAATQGKVPGSERKAVHFVGVGGIGMSALAQVLYQRGQVVTGSDRYLDLGLSHARLEKLRTMGIRLFPQDGSGVTRETGQVVVSTAIERSNPDLARAREFDVPVSHRSELLAELFHRAAQRVAVTGSCGKTTVTAMIGWIMRVAGRRPTVINGGIMRNFEGPHAVGNAVTGEDDVVVIEADESDGTCVLYRPTVGVVTGVARDHQETDRIVDLYRRFVGCTESLAVVDSEARGTYEDVLRCRAVTFGLDEGAGVRARDVRCDAQGSRFRTDREPFRLSVIGRHNVRNALAALAVCRELGVPEATAAEALASFRGVARRLETVGVPRGARIYDDYAHSPTKVVAAIDAARVAGAARVFAVFQPHGFGPARFMRSELAAVLASALRARDRAWLLPIYYVGGTVSKDVCSEEIAAECRRAGAPVEAVPSRPALIEQLAHEVRDGDAVLVMGARDDSLSDLATAIAAELETVDAP